MRPGFSWKWTRFLVLGVIFQVATQAPVSAKHAKDPKSTSPAASTTSPAIIVAPHLAAQKAIQKFLGRSASIMAALASGSGVSGRGSSRLGSNTGPGQSSAASYLGAPMRIGAASSNSVDTNLLRPQFDIWIQAGAAHYTDARDGNSNGHAGVLYVGADYVLQPSVLVGIAMQLDRMADNSKGPDFTADSQGWMLGPYMSISLTPNIFFDARASWGRASDDIKLHDVNSGNFDTDRGLASAKLAADWSVGTLHVRPSTQVMYVRQRQRSYLNNIGVYIPGQTISLGRSIFGFDLAQAFTLEDDFILEPYLGLKGIWDFKSADQKIAAGNIFSSDKFHGRLEAGATLITSDGITFRGSGLYDGIGISNYHVYQASLSVIVPIN